MSQDKGNAIFLGVMLLGLILHTNLVQAATYTVGDSAGWDFYVAGWENGKSFKAGDRLVFKYPSTAHNVVVVDKSSYDSCSVPGGAKRFTSGKDKITLGKGANYFICGIPGHCQFGMKIAANAS